MPRRLPLVTNWDLSVRGVEYDRRSCSKYCTKVYVFEIQKVHSIRAFVINTEVRQSQPSALRNRGPVASQIYFLEASESTTLQQNLLGFLRVIGQNEFYQSPQF